MARPRLYLTDDEKQAASRLKSQRYYEKHKSRINKARRKKYSKTSSNTNKSQINRAQHKKYSKTASQVHKRKIRLESASVAEDTIRNVDASDSNIIDGSLKAVLTLEGFSEDKQTETMSVTDVSSSAEDSDEPPSDYLADWEETSEDEQIEAAEITDIPSSAEDSDKTPFDCLTNWGAQVQDIEELFDKFVEENPARFMELAAQQYQENLSMASLELAARTLAGPHSDVWIRSESSRRKVQTSIDWIEEIICAALIGPEEIAIMVRKSEFSYQAK